MRSTKLKLTSTVLTLAVAMSFTSCTSETKETELSEETTTAETTIKETEATTETTEPTEVVLPEDLIFPDEPYDADKVHPIREPGEVTGEDAVTELNAIEASYLQYFYNDNYAAINIQLKDPDKYGITCDKVYLGDVGVGDYKADVETLKSMLDRLYKLDFESLGKQDRDFYDQIVFDIEEEIYYRENPGFIYLKPQYTPSDASFFCQTLADINVRNEEEAENYLTLLIDSGRYLDDLMEFEEKRIELGYGAINSYYIDMSVIFSMNTDPEQTNMLREDFEGELNSIEGLSDDKKDGYLTRFDDAIDNVLIPKFNECSERYMSYRGSGINETGLCGFEHGKELFEHQIRAMVGRDCDVNELASYLDEYLTKENIPYGKVTIEGKDEFEVLDNTEEIMKDYFPTIDYEYEVRDLPDVMKAAGIGGLYTAGYLDDNSNEIIYLNGLVYGADVVLHEGMPGHMYQFSYHKNTLDHLYMLVKENDLHCEGWATYIMANPADMYGIESDTDLIYMTDTFYEKYFEARIDIGVNYEGWTYDEALSHFREIGVSRISEIDTEECIIEPGGGLYYGLGCLMTLKTLENIRALDPDMDTKTMHTLYLDAGPGTFERIFESVKREINE